MALMAERRPRERWTKATLEQVNLILWAAWDPIGMGVPLDEYEAYVPKVAGLLENGATADEIAGVLGDIRSGAMGIKRDPALDSDIAWKIVDWYATVVAP
jgi:hypothetical protein